MKEKHKYSVIASNQIFCNNININTEVWQTTLAWYLGAVLSFTCPGGNTAEQLFSVEKILF